MSRIPYSATAAACLLFLSGIAAAQAVETVTPLNRTVAGQVTPGRASAIGVLIPQGTLSVSVAVKFGKGGNLDPEFSVVLPDGTVLDQADLALAGAVLSVSAKGVKGKGIPAPQTGLYKFVLRGRNGTMGAYSMALKGKAPKRPILSGSFAGSGEIDDYAIAVPSGSVLSVAAVGAKGFTFFPLVEVLTSSGHSLDLSGHKTESVGSATVAGFPLPWFGTYTVRLKCGGGAGSYTLRVTVATAKSAPAGRPVANAGGNIVVEPGTLAALAGSGSAGASFRWEQVSGSTVPLNQATSAVASFTAPPDKRTMLFSLVSFNNGVASAESFAVAEIDSRPIAVGGPSQSASAGALVALDASESFDLDPGEILSYRWTQVAGSPVTLSDPNAAAPTFAAPLTDGAVAFEVRAHDGVAESRPDRVVIGVGVAVADAGRPVLGPPDDTVFLSGARSIRASGAVGGIFAWSGTDTESSSLTIEGADTATPAVTLPRTTGEWRFRLILDGEDASADEVLVLASKFVGGGSPSASAGGRQNVSTGAPITLTSGGAGASLANHEWRQTSGPDALLAGTGPTRSGTAASTPDVQRFLLLTHDGRRYSPPDLATVVAGALPAPVADAGADRTGNTGAAITLNGTASAAPAGRTITGYSWVQTSGLDFYDVDARDAGFNPSTASPSFTVPSNASSLTSTRKITFALTVTDSTAATSAPDTVVVEFTNLPPNAAPEVQATASATVVRPSTPVSLLGTATDPDGDPLTLQWALVSGPASVTILNSTTLNASFTAPSAAGAYQFRLRADDGTGTANATGQSTVTVTVNTPPDLSSVAATPDSGPAATLVTLSAAFVTDPDGDTLTFAWTELAPPGGVPVALTGAATSTASFTVPAYAGNRTARTRTFRVTVTDFLGPTTKDVTFVPNVAPTLGTVNATATKIRYDNVATSTLSAPSAADADGDPFTITWLITAGPSTSSSLLSATTGASVQFTVPKPNAGNPSRGGVYTIRATISDGAISGTPVDTKVLAFPSWANDVYPIISANCLGCHGAGASGGLNMSSAGTAYSSLRNVASNGSSALRVKPNDHANSYLWQRVNSGQMPQGGSKLSQDLLNIIRDWIEPDGTLGSSGLSTGAENN